MDYLGHKKFKKNNGIYSSIDGIQEVGGLVLLTTFSKKSTERYLHGMFLRKMMH